MGKRKSSSKATPSAPQPKQQKKANKDDKKSPKNATPNSALRRSNRNKKTTSPPPEAPKETNSSTPKGQDSVPSPSTPCRPQGSQQDSKCTATPKSNVPSSVEEFGDPIVKSPLDTHGYKMVRLTENGFKGLLISTCYHPPDINTKKLGCGDQPSARVFERITEFNETHANFKTKTPCEGKACDGGNCQTVNFSKATKTQEKAANLRRENIRSRIKVVKDKCRRCIIKNDDNMEDFCNNKFLVVLFIKAGFFQDPQDLPGMAHFCEHVITLKSEKFSGVEPLITFVESEGDGECTAGTDYEWTAHHFYVNQESIDHSLEILSDIFTHPEFPQNFVQDEIDNMNSEFEVKRLNDSLRENALFQSCVLDGHPAANFGMGSKDSLPNKDKTKAEEIIARIKDWMGRYYCTENMMFAIQGPKTLPELEKLFFRYFAKVPTRFGNFPGSTCAMPAEPCSSLPPINWSKWNRLYHMVSTGESNRMSVSWALDPKFGKNYATKPITYYSYLICRKEVGSLEWFLKWRGWITTLNIQDTDFYTTNYYAIFSINIELTVEGLSQRIKVLRAVFSYIKLLQQHKACPAIFDEVRQLKADLFHYRSDNNLSDPTLGRPFDNCSATSTYTIIDLFQTLAKTGSPSRMLLDTFLLTKYDAEVLNEFAKCLKPSRAMVLFASSIFEKEANEKERWYQTRYFTKPMCHELISDIEQNPPDPLFTFPKPNPFVSTSMCFPDAKSSKERVEKKPDLLLYESDKGQVQYGNSRCQKGLLPTAQYSIDFRSPVLEDLSDMINCPSAELLESMVKYVLETDLAMALNSLISYEVALFQGHLNVTLFGPSAKLPQLAKIVLNTVSRLSSHIIMLSTDPLRADLPRMTVVSDMIKVSAGHFKNMIHSSEDCASSLLDYVVKHTGYFLSDYLHVLENLYDPEDFRRFLTNFNSRMFIDADLNGCVTKGQATEFSQQLQATSITPYERKNGHEVFERALKLPLGERCLYVKAKNKDDRNVVVVNYYQVGEMTELQRAMFMAIFSYLAEKSFKGLRTKLRLGYFESVDLLEIAGILGLKIYVQGTADASTCGFVDEGIDTFLLNIFKEAFASQKAFTDNILAYSPDFDFKLADAKKFFEAHFFPGGSSFRKLSIQIKGHKKSSCSQPAQPRKLNEKVAKYSSGVKLPSGASKADGGSYGISTFARYLDLCLKNVQEENGYYITDVQKFKDGLPCFGNIEELLEDD